MGLSHAATAKLLRQKLREIRPPGQTQVYVNLVPDLRFGHTSIAGHLAYRSLYDPGLRVCSYVHEFTEGVRRYGSSDSAAAYPTSDPRSPADFCATVYHLLGIPSDTVIQDNLGRPHTLIVGQTIEPILA